VGLKKTKTCCFLVALSICSNLLNANFEKETWLNKICNINGRYERCLVMFVEKSDPCLGPISLGPSMSDWVLAWSRTYAI
jgi:hypothetical protein